MSGLLLALTAGALAGDVVHVPRDVATLQAAVDETDATTIVLAPGEHAGATISRPVTVIGRQASITSGPVAGAGLRVGLALTPEADGTRIQQITFACDAATLDGGVYARTVRGQSADDVTIDGNTFRQCVQAVTNRGDEAGYCDEAPTGGARWVIADNTFNGLDTRTDRGQSGGGHGVVVFNAPLATVSSNRFTGLMYDDPAFAAAAVLLTGCHDCAVTDNVFEMSGAQHAYSSVVNGGGAVRGGIASERLLLADNDASADATPTGRSFVSLSSYALSPQDNLGTLVVDHRACGDGVDATVHRGLDRSVRLAP